VITSKKGKVYILEENDNKLATIHMDDGIIINIWTTVSEKEIIDIVNGLMN